MYAIKQIKICAEYQDILHRSRLDLLGTTGLPDKPASAWVANPGILHRS